MGVLREREDLAATRYTRGLASSLDIYRVRRDLLDTQAGLPRLESQLASVEGRLAVLLGGYRRDLGEVLPESLTPAPTWETPCQPEFRPISCTSGRT